MLNSFGRWPFWRKRVGDSLSRLKISRYSHPYVRGLTVVRSHTSTGHAEINPHHNIWTPIVQFHGLSSAAFFDAQRPYLCGAAVGCLILFRVVSLWYAVDFFSAEQTMSSQRKGVGNTEPSMHTVSSSENSHWLLGPQLGKGLI
jgi:hypothetical protein